MDDKGCASGGCGTGEVVTDLNDPMLQLGRSSRTRHGYLDPAFWHQPARSVNLLAEPTTSTPTGSTQLGDPALLIGRRTGRVADMLAEPASRSTSQDSGIITQPGDPALLIGRGAGRPVEMLANQTLAPLRSMRSTVGRVPGGMPGVFALPPSGKDDGEPSDGAGGYYVRPGYDPESDCFPVSLDWSDASSDCPPSGLTSATVEDVCGPAPCASPFRSMPKEGYAASATERLQVKFNDNKLIGGGDRIHDEEEWESLIRCAWTILMDNLDLVEYILCVLTGNPDAGRCLVNEIEKAKLDIEINYQPDPPLLGGFVDLSTGVVLVAASTAAFLTGFFTFGGSILVGAGIALAGAMKTFTFYVERPSNQATLEMWMAVDEDGNNNEEEQLCACVYIAALLLHELGHRCARELADPLLNTPGVGADLQSFLRTLAVGDCFLLQALRNSFGNLVLQRYSTLVEGPQTLGAEEVTKGGCFGLFNNGWMNDRISNMPAE